jgi:hypothetical protein
MTLLNFSPLVHFGRFLVRQMHQGERLHLFFGHHKQWGPPAKTASEPLLKCSDIGPPTLTGQKVLNIRVGGPMPTHSQQWVKCVDIGPHTHILNHAYNVFSFTNIAS